MVIPFSFGKDSLLSLATSLRLGYDIILVNIDERVLPRGKKIREKLEKQITKDLQLSCHTVTNEIQLLSVSIALPATWRSVITNAGVTTAPIVPRLSSIFYQWAGTHSVWALRFP